MRIGGFEFSDGARFQAGAPHDAKAAKAVGDHLELLRKQHQNELTPEDVLEDAKHDNSPLHPYFEWSDSAAAHQHRLAQARGLIRSVVAIYVSEDKPAVRTKAFVHIAEPSAPHYREASHAMSQQKTRKMVLQQAWRELQAWKSRYKHLQEFSDLITVIDEVDRHLPKAAKH
ncbi:hypothetical protein ACHMW4_03955 [Mesorhizobium sp. UC22_110]|uniref:hypothetical protein n=1 Tax=unclassified Mesorhizobium TaxID=325217 RepID=UPI003672BB45